MADRVFPSVKFHVKLALIAAGFVVIPAPVLAQANATAPKSAALPALAYDVVSIRPHPPERTTNWGWRTTADGFFATNLTVRDLIFSAYGLIIEDQIAGLPGWAHSDRFDMQAKMGDAAIKTYNGLSDDQQGKEQQLLLQAVLADRFQLKVHHETKELPIYELTVANGGVKLKKVAEDKNGGMAWGAGLIKGTAVNAAHLASGLSAALGRIVVDKTGLIGSYDVALRWTPDDKQETATSGPRIFAALEEQLGLKLVPAKGPVDTIVVDHVEKPSPN